jgi:ribonuclease J
VTPTPQLEIVPLGGLGEFGMNCMVYRFGDDAIVVDAGMMFPGAEHLGVDVVLPDLSYLTSVGRLHGVLLTHGHEDHIGALPHLLSTHDVPVWATPYTLALIRKRLEEHPDAPAPALRTLPEGRESLSLGPFRIETIPVVHSIPQTRMLVIATPLGVIVHTADFKLDPTPPDGDTTDLDRLAEVGRRGVLALLSDSTNAEVPGFTAGEASLRAGFDALIASARRRIVVTTFASHVSRINQIGRLCAKHRRRVALVGRSVERHAEVAEELGLLRVPSRIPPEQVMELPPEQVLVIASGSQGEPMSSMTRIALDTHRDVALEPGDLVVHSARVIPGSAQSVGRLINHALRRGAEVVTAERGAPIHVSGHPAREELKLLIRLLRPRFFVPVHGEYRQLWAHAALARDCGLERDAVVLAESGDVIGVRERSISIVDRVHVGHVFIDATLDQVDWEILRERRRIAWDGIVVPVVRVDRQKGVVDGSLEILARGFVPDVGADRELLDEARRAVERLLANASPEERSDEALLKARVQAELKRLFRRHTQRRPLVLPVIVEL